MRSRLAILLVWLLTIAISTVGLTLAMVAVCKGQTGRVVTFDDFSGGMNTNSNASKIAPNEASYLRNLVIDDPEGALKIRPGYTKVRDSLSLFSQTLALHSHKLDNGNTFLFHVEQWKDSGLAGIYASKSNSRYGGATAGDTAWASSLYPTPGFFLTWHGLDFYFNGRNRPRVFNLAFSPSHVKASAPIHRPAPGQLDANPIAQAGNPNGTYQYAQVIQIPCSTQTGSAVPWADRFGVLSVPTEAYGEKIRVSNYTALIADSVCATAASDSIWVLTLRTRGGSNDYETDSLFIIDSVKLRNDGIAAYVYTDNTHDSLLGASRFFARIKSTTTRWSWSRGGKNTAYAPGSMTVRGSDTLIGSDPDTVLGSACFSTSGNYANNLYFYCWLDTETGQLSDSSSILSVYRDAGIDRNLLLGIPLPPSSRYQRVLYRAHFVVGHNDEDALDGDLGFQNQVFYALDTLVLDTQTTFKDAVNPCSLEVWNSPYNRKVPLTNFAGAIVHENRLYGWDADQVYFSVSDTADFPFFNALEFDLGQGDPILRLVSFEGFIVVYKRYSTWILYTRDGAAYDARKASNDLGLVSPYAVASYGNQNFVVGQNGLYSEASNPYRDHDLDRDYLDDKYPLPTAAEADISKACAIVFNDRLMVSYPGEDEARVLFLKTNGWGWWDFDFQASCVYDTAWGYGVQARPVMLFVPPGSTKIMALDDTAKTDAGTAFQGYWQKKYIGIESDQLSTVSSARMWWDGGPADSIKVEVNVLNDQSYTMGTVYFDRLNTKSFDRKYFGLAHNPVGHFYWLRTWIPPQGPLTIRKIELELTPAGLD